MTCVATDIAQAKPETVEKVCHIVKKQLALAPEVSVTGHSKFSELGADSLDTVCMHHLLVPGLIVRLWIDWCVQPMHLHICSNQIEEFGIN